MWYVAALAAVAAAAGGQTVCAAGIGVVGGVQAVLVEPGVGPLMDVAAFEAPDRLPYLLAVGYEGIYTINVTDPLDPVRAGGISHTEFDRWWLGDVEMFYAPDGRVYAAMTGGGLWALDVTDPANPVMVDGAPEGAGGPSAFVDACCITVLEPPDGRIYVLVTGGNVAPRTVDITDPHHPVILEGDRTLGTGYWNIDGAAFEPGDGRTYVAYVGHPAGVLIVDVTDPHGHVLVSAVRHYDGGHPPEGEDPFQAHGIPAPPSDVPIADVYAEGLGHADEVAVFGSPEGRTYVMVANSISNNQIDGSDPYVVPPGIILLDVTDPHDPVPVGHILDGEGGADFGSRIWDVAILGSPGGRVHAAVADNLGVTILDVTDPAGPVLLNHMKGGKAGFDAIDIVRGMDIVEPPGGGAYLAAAGNEGIQMVDVTDPGAPAAAGDIPNESFNFGKPTVFELGDGRTYALGAGWGAVSMVDITDPHYPVPLGSIRDGEGGFDVLDGAHQLEALHTPDGRIYAMATGGEGLQVIEMTDPAAPVPAGILHNGTDSFEVGPLIINTAILRHPEDGDYLLVADHDRGIHVVDITDPGAPAMAGGLRGGEGGIDLLGGVHDMDVFDAPGGRPYALMTGDFGIHTIDMDDPAAPVVAGTLDGSVRGSIGWNTPTIIHQSVVFEPAGGRIHALLADYASGIHIVDLTDPRAPAYMGSVPTGEGGADVIPGSAVAAVASPDGRAYALVAGWDEIQILNITDPYSPAPVGAVPAGEGGLGLEWTPWDIITMDPAGGRIHALASGGDRLWVLDVTHPISPAVPHVGRWDGAGHVSGGGPLYTHAGEAAGPHHHYSTGTVVPSPAGDVAIIEFPDGHTYAVHVGPAGGLLAVDITGPHAATDPGVWWLDPREAGWPPAALDGLGVAPVSVELFRPHDGRTYMMMGGGDTILVVDVTYPSEPMQVSAIRDNLGGFYSLGAIRDISAFASPDGRVHALVGGGDGIQMIDVTNPYAPSPAGSIHEVPGIPAYGDIHRIAAVQMPDGRVMALAADGVGRAGMLDVTDPRLPVPAGAIPPADGAGPVLDIATFEAPGGRLHVLLVGENISRTIDITDPGDPVPVAILDAAAPERPQGGPHAESSMVRVAIRTGSANAECMNVDGCYFVPRTVTIGVGDTVTWINEDDTAHSFGGMLDADDGTGWAFDSGRLLPGAEFSHRFEEAGEYTYFGFPHPWMTGTVVVEAAE